MALNQLGLGNVTYPTCSGIAQAEDFPAGTVTGWQVPEQPVGVFPSGVVLGWTRELAQGTTSEAGFQEFAFDVETPTAGATQPDDLARLQIAYAQVMANAAPFATFASAVRAIDWGAKSPSAFELQLEALVIARELARLGHGKYPGNASLASAAHVLAPPKVIERNRPPKKGLSASMAWLEEHANEYRGYWIAVQNGGLLDAAATRSDLVDKLGELAIESNVLIVRIP
jgi:hypothetical protein